MINNTNGGRWERLSAKSLDMQFLHEMYEGLNCSRFEAAAILEKVHEVFEPLLEEGAGVKPGQIQLPVVDASVGPGRPLKEAKQQLVTLTLESEEYTAVRRREGVGGVRRARLERMAEEAFQQGGLLTIEDFAYRVFNCGLRTLVRDLGVLRKEGITVPLRSTVKDMGRAVTHREQIVRMWLKGEEYTEIARGSHHSVESVRNYVEKFKRSVVLFTEGYDVHTVGFLVRISPTLAGEFLRVYQESDMVEHRREELEGGAKKSPASWEERGTAR